MVRFNKMIAAASVALFAGSLLASEDIVVEESALSNYQRSTTTGISALSQLYLSTEEDGVSTLMRLCSNSSGYPASNNPRLLVAAVGYDQTAVPYAAVENPTAWCRCVIQVAAMANQVAAEKLDVSGYTALPTAMDLERPMLLPNKHGNGVTSCRAAGWRVDFRPDGLLLQKSGVQVLGGDQKVVAGKSVTSNVNVSQSWVE